MVPLLLFLAFLSNLILSLFAPWYFVLLVTQVVFYLIAFWGWWQDSPPVFTLLKIPVYFVAVNAAIALAWWRYLLGQRLVMWTPSER
jgi:hypothetical protein